MTELISLTPARALDRLDDWQLAMRAENKSPATIACYTDATTRYLRWCADSDHPPMSRTALNGWISGMLEAGAAPSTARTRQMCVRRFASWLTEGGYLPAYPFPGVKAPRVPAPIVQPLTDDELRALIRTCTPPAPEDLTEAGDQALHHRRDEAIIRLMLETAIRSGEVIALTVDDVDLDGFLVTIRRGKGGRGRVIPIGLDTALSIERYLGIRARHPRASDPSLWLGGHGKAFSQNGLIRSLSRRAARAGIDNFRPHRLRHTAAHRWLAAGGSETGLMAMAGWTRSEMLIRYTRARASERAAEEAWGLDLGNL
ncbi:MAG TPA: site-specific integrase [Gemmatimonadales bacterium]|nr:site-specific integrase [Gemmatimonadales bacterium]